ncbi:MAG TPA: YbhB/YbcL family Raf kinase inhibitor-like protein [Verrucomicrobiae bacterium]|nr:YbhB/YbcL family Raf kinase inhibitor-like protein [Verrucomicrobiae bacterium]
MIAGVGSEKRFSTVVLCWVLTAGVGVADAAGASGKGTMQLTSTAFGEGQSIPSKYTCDGENVSPPLSWNGLPQGTKSLALIADDPDAPSGTWVHWVLYDLPPTTTELPEGLAKSQYIPGGAKQGLNDFKHLGYGGPCPPPGKAHRYYLKLYALDRVLELKPGATKNEVERAMEKHTLAQSQLMGMYKRK